MLIAADTPHTEYCKIELTEDKLKAFMYAVKNKYWYQMYVDDLPIWGKWKWKCPLLEKWDHEETFLPFQGLLEKLMKIRKSTLSTPTKSLSLDITEIELWM